MFSLLLRQIRPVRPSVTFANSAKTNSIAGLLKKEFQCKQFGFQYETEYVFVSSQWPCYRWLFVIYRVLLATYAILITFFSIFGFGDGPEKLPWAAWLTNWSYFILTCHLLCSMLIVILSAFFDSRDSVGAEQPAHRATPIYVKFNAILFSIAIPAAFIVTTVYFAAVFPMRHRGVSVGDLNLHIINSVLALLELTVTALPVRLLHIVYVYMYGVAYVVFSIVYWAIDNNNVMYPGVLDWNSPKQTAIVLMVLVLVGLPVLQTCVFAVYRLRIAIYQRLFQQSSYLN